jgi:hypothetical protein
METIRVVSQDRDYHVECYVCEDCDCQLTDEVENRCYPIGKSLLCYRCHLNRVAASSEEFNGYKQNTNGNIIMTTNNKRQFMS